MHSLANVLNHPAKNKSDETTLIFIVRKGWYYSYKTSWAEELIKGCAGGQLEEVQDLINAPGPFKETVAHYCARINDYWFLKALLTFKPDLLIKVRHKTHMIDFSYIPIRVIEKFII